VREPQPLTRDEEPSYRSITDLLPHQARRVWATLDAAREQAATEARRELLAKVEGLAEDDWLWHAGIEYIAASAVMGIFEDYETRRLIEESQP
jgi:hypothetical protein